MERKKKAVIVCFSVRSEKFESNYERNKFFRELYGWKQIIKREEKKYIYKRNGLLNRVPHIKVHDSVFIIAKKHLDEIQRFLEEWEDKVIWNVVDILMESKKWKMLVDDVEVI